MAAIVAATSTTAIYLRAARGRSLIESGGPGLDRLHLFLASFQQRR